jgi:molecular chaperone GrpE
LIFDALALISEVMNDTTDTPMPGHGAGQEAQADPAQAAAPKPSTSLDRELADMKDRLLRTLAEMENLRKRTEREVADARTYGVTGFARDILTVADNMHRAMSALDDELRSTAGESLKGLLDGVELTERELLNVLEKHGVKKLEPLKQKFDPNRHQAMYEIEDASVPSGTVLQVVQSGYTIGERVLRPALVGVSKGGPKAGAAAPAEPPANDNAG